MSSRTLPIAVVARETGLTRELLRKWESRYGFPLPVRSDSGRRGYPLEQLEALREVKRLTDAGIRPGEAIRRFTRDKEAEAAFGPSSCPATGMVADCLALIREHDAAGLYARLERKLASVGARTFIAQTAAPLTVAVGEAWLEGELRVHEEHMFSATLASLLSAAYRRLQAESGSPRILLTTLPGELHTLGMDMVRVLFAESGATCLTLGAQTPLAEIAAAVAAYDVQVLALSFSTCYPVRLLGPSLSELRTLLPAALPIWIGGAGTLVPARLPDGVRVFVADEDIHAAIRELQERDDIL